MSPRRPRTRHLPIDVAGRDVRIGDWVRVTRMPDSIARMPLASKRAFSRAVGKTFQIEAFNELGCAELDLTGKVGSDTIWIEPSCVQRFRRPKKQSLRFRRVLMHRRKFGRARWSLRYVAKYHSNDNPDKLISQLQRDWASHGWYVLEQQTEIHGTFYARDKTLRSKQRLEKLKDDLWESDLFVSVQVDRVRLAQRAAD